MDNLKPCPVTEFMLDNAGLYHNKQCLDCPNRAPSQAEKEMREKLQKVHKWFLSVCDKPDCTCDHGTYAKEIETILTKYPKGNSNL